MAAAPVVRNRPRVRAGLSAGLVATALVAGGTTAAQAQQPGSQQQPPADAVAQMMDSNGGTVGEVRVRELAQGILLVVELDNLPEGAHGFHIHETGTCEPPDFESAGDHYAPLDNDHGYANRRGYHGGDLPNVHANANGWVRAEFFVPHLALTEERERDATDDSSAFAPDAPGPFPLLDDDGSAVMVHERPDDYESQSSGNAGGRIACGVIEPAGGGQGQGQGQGQGGQGQGGQGQGGQGQGG